MRCIKDSIWLRRDTGSCRRLSVVFRSRYHANQKLCVWDMVGICYNYEEYPILLEFPSISIKKIGIGACDWMFVIVMLSLPNSTLYDDICIIRFHLERCFE